MMKNIRPDWVLWGLAAGAVLIFLPGVLRRIGAAPFDLAGGAVEGAGNLLMDLTPFPNTSKPENISECDKALAAGDDLLASFYCPASKWGKGLFDSEWF